MKKPILAAIGALCLTLPLAGIADDDHDDHGDHHVAEAGAIRIVHPWARAAAKGASTLVFMEIENNGAPDLLEGAHSEAAEAARIVGITFKDGIASTVGLDAIDIPEGDFDLDPGGIAIELVGLGEALEQGSEIEIELIFRDAGEVHLHAEVEAANATQHSHAGHAH